MPLSKKTRDAVWSKINGLVFVSLFALASFYISNYHTFEEYAISPLVIALVLGLLFGNALRHKIPATWTPGIQFTGKQILKLGIVLYGFRITFQEAFQVGKPGLILDLFTLITTFFLSVWVGKKLLKLDRDSTMLIGAGSAICGAAAILATEEVLKSPPHKTTTALATVILFGTITIFLYPFLQFQILNWSEVEFGVFTGGTVREVGQVIAISNAVGPVAESTGLIVKMTRVMLLAPFLTLLSYFIGTKTGSKLKTSMIPWFAIGFLVVCGFNSLELLPTSIVNSIKKCDTFLLSMAMAAIGLETNFKKLKETGLKAFCLGGVLLVWQLVTGYYLILWMKDLQIL